VAAFVAHEINTPLTNIALLSASIARGVQDPFVLEKLQKLDRQRRLAGTIVTELLSLSRSHELRRIPVDVRRVVASATEQIIESHDGSIAVVSDPGIGSTFTITLPIETVDAPKGPALSTAPEPMPKAP